MSRTIRVILIPIALVLGVAIGHDEAFAKGGRGGSRGGKSSYAGGGSRGAGTFKKHGRSVFRDRGSFYGGNSDRTNSGVPQGRSHFKSAAPGAPSVGRTVGIQPGTNSGIAHDMTRMDGGTLEHHRSRELAKLNHRRQVSDQLRSISAKNGNENLNRVADEMDRRALYHYDKQMTKFDPSYIPDDPIGDQTERLTDRMDLNQLDEAPPLGVPPAPDGSLTPATQKLTGTENALSRQVLNEERKLAKRLESVEAMRQLASQSGDDALLQAADRLEEWSMNDFDQRMIKITDFQERHGLPDVTEFLSQ